MRVAPARGPGPGDRAARKDLFSVITKSKHCQAGCG